MYATNLSIMAESVSVYWDTAREDSQNMINLFILSGRQNVNLNPNPVQKIDRYKNILKDTCIARQSLACTQGL